MSAYNKYELKDRSGRTVKEFTVGPSGNPMSPEKAQETVKWFLYNNPKGQVVIKPR